jgi:hypothetical protein
MSNNRTNRSFRPERQPRMLSNELVATGDDADARQKVYTLGAPKAVLIKVDAKVNLGLPKQTPPTPEQQKLKQEQVLAAAAKLGVDPDAYIDRLNKQHTGTQPIHGAARVRLDLLVADLLAAGYKLVQVDWFQKPARNGKLPAPTQQFHFALDREAIEMTEAVKTFLAEVYVDNFFIWCNPRKEDGEIEKFYRLDTLNGQSGHRPVKPDKAPGVRLRYDATNGLPGGYELVDPNEVAPAV